MVLLGLAARSRAVGCSIYCTRSNALAALPFNWRSKSSTYCTLGQRSLKSSEYTQSRKPRLACAAVVTASMAATRSTSQARSAPFSLILMAVTPLYGIHCSSVSGRGGAPPLFPSPPAPPPPFFFPPPRPAGPAPPGGGSRGGGGARFGGKISPKPPPKKPPLK